MSRFGWKALCMAVCTSPLLLWATDAIARPGGGQSYSGGGGGGGGYSGGGGSYGGGGGGDGGGGGELLFYLIFEVPAIGIPLLLLVIGSIVWGQANKLKGGEWNSMPYIPPPPPDLTQLRRLDPEFSIVLFEDFVYQLYAEAHRTSGDSEKLALLSPQLSERAKNALIHSPGTMIDRVVIGSMTVSSLTLPDMAKTADGHPYYVNLSIRFESNISGGKGDTARGFYVDETWTFARAADVLSPPPQRMRASLCANCGAPYVNSAERTCQSCNEVVDSGRFGWLVTSVARYRIESRPPSLTGYAPEVGTEDATRIRYGTDQELRGLQVDDPAFNVKGIIARATMVFQELYLAWNADDLARARPYVSDSLFNYLAYWLDAYRSEGLANLVDDHKITGFTVAKLIRDRHYDAITIRIWAQGADYTRDKAGRVVGGSKNTSRFFSEYWTFIRRANHHGGASTMKQCPQCGAEQRISMAGICEYCNSHITSGEFDWILSKIEQDESYHG